MSRKKVAIRNIPNRLLPTRPGRASTIGLRAIGRSKNKRVSSDTHGVEPDGEVFSIVLPLAGTGGRPNRCTVCKQRSWRSVSWPIPCLSHARRRAHTVACWLADSYVPCCMRSKIRLRSCKFRALQTSTGSELYSDLFCPRLVCLLSS